MANQATCATNATAMPAVDGQIHGVTGNKKDGKTTALRAPP
jgi:ABC-type Na+ transport system ATPase subunit NatA